MEMKETFNAATLFQCRNVYCDSDLYNENTLWRQTILGCKIVHLLQWIHGFNVSYIYQQQELKRDLTTEIKVYSENSTVDFYVRPMSLRADVLALATPIGAIFDWDFGFTISYPDMRHRNFYSKPFTRQVWNFLYFMALFCSIFFYLLKRWETRLQREGRRECSFGYELLMVVGAYTQHIPPIEARILSRRTAYFVFFIFAYVVYTYYTSNLLSHLVSDTNDGISLQELVNSDIECVVLSSVKAILNNNVSTVTYCSYSYWGALVVEAFTDIPWLESPSHMFVTIMKLYASQILSIYRGDKIDANYLKLLQLKPVSMEEGLEAVRTTKTAFLTDYVTIAPYIRKVYNSDEICSLAQVDVVVNLQKYLFVSKTFPFEYMEQFKVSILRLKESGLLSRLVDRYYNDDGSIECTPLPHVQAQFLQVLYPLMLLLGTYVLCLIILGIEIWHFNRYRVWPFVN